MAKNPTNLYALLTRLIKDEIIIPELALDIFLAAQSDLLVLQEDFFRTEIDRLDHLVDALRQKEDRF